MSSSQVDLVVDWCSYEAAKFAVENWHYSKSMPSGKLNRIGVWENDNYIGCVLFGRGANKNIGKPYGLCITQIAELVRVALSGHETTVTHILSKSINLFKKHNEEIRLIISYADERQGHKGIIYQASNWIYTGTIPLDLYELNGEYHHPRSVVSRYGTRSLPWLKENVNDKYRKVEGLGKHKYIYPLDKGIKRQAIKLSKPYPKDVVCGQSVNGDTLATGQRAGSIPDARSYCTD